MSKRLTTEEFVEKARKVHGDKYDYSLVDYVNAKTKVKIICPKHGQFEQMPGSHLSGKGCKKCGIEKLSSQFCSNTKDFVKRANIVHNNLYDYSLVNYVHSHSKVTIICPIHGEFKQKPYTHLQGNGCHKCSGRFKLDNKTFIEKSNTIHNNKYDYSMVKYINSYTKVKILCPIHGLFKQLPQNHLQDQGCPKCKSIISKGEIQVQKFIQKIYSGNISLNDRKTIKNPKTNRFIELDIYIPDKNLAIEYNGNYWHNRPEIIEKDNYKKEFCRKNEIYLMTIDDDKWMKDKNYKEIIKITLKNLLINK